MNNKILIIIPARGGSKGIPRKNLRILNGYPLIYYVIKTSLLSKFEPDVYVSSDDDEILTISKKFGAKTHKRDRALAGEKTTLDPVVINAFREISEKNKLRYDVVITIQPTSPLLSVKTLDDAISHFLNHPEVETLLSATEDTHLSWGKKDGKFFPNYVKRVNRQELPSVYRETGAFFISRPDLFRQNTRIGEKVDLFLVPDQEKTDVDTFEDWSICEFHLKRKKILFVITGYDQVGLGHVYNALAIADEILEHQVIFLVDNQSGLAYDKIKKAHHSVYMQNESNIIDDIKKLDPDIIINDRLDTEETYVRSLKKISKMVINFEDLGSGSYEADLVINAMYPENRTIENHFYGKDYYVLRNEFQYSDTIKTIHKEVRNVVITFGGTDPNNFTLKVVEEIYDNCRAHNIEIHVVLGMGYNKLDSIRKFSEIRIFQNIAHLSEVISLGDICFTSAGRTTFEIASIGVPTIVLCQNHRESTHFFASEKNGFINLGENDNIPAGKILQTFMDLSDNYETRISMHRQMVATNLRNGKKKVLELIRKHIT
jgi:CMP-N-acetylneuraminic acid synthetase/spore coat polysaccharide biosynthesis predicted glycosyltransferase SpsG